VYTGIVQGAYPVVAVEQKPGLHSLAIALDAARTDKLLIGASVAVDGVCLTVTALDGDRVYFDVMQQTLQQTTLGSLAAGDRVNIERSARYGDEIGGHGLSGHIDAAVDIVAVNTSQNNRELCFSVPPLLRPYVFQRGFIGLNGCSLTVAELDAQAGTFKVCLIPETLRVTTFGDKVVGDRVNLELDRQTQAIVDTVRGYLADNKDMLRSLLRE
jgi:riboflavin synthase